MEATPHIRTTRLGRICRAGYARLFARRDAQQRVAQYPTTSGGHSPPYALGRMPRPTGKVGAQRAVRPSTSATGGGRYGRAGAKTAIVLLLLLNGCTFGPGLFGPRSQARKAPPAEPDVKLAQSVSEPARPESDEETAYQDAAEWARQIAGRDDLQLRIERSTPRRPEAEPAASASPRVNSTQDSQTTAAAADESTPDKPRNDPSAKPTPPNDVKPSKPPAVGSLTIASDPVAPPAANASVEPGAPAVNAPEAAQAGPATLQSIIDAYPADEDSSEFRTQLDKRILQVVAGDFEAARAPLELVSDQQQEMAARFIESLIAIRAGHGGDPTGEARRVLGEIGHLRDSLLPLAELEISRLEICRAVRGFGQFDRFEPATFRAGVESEFVTYAELADFVSKRGDDGAYTSSFSMRTSVLSRAGDVVLDIKDDAITDVCRTRRRDCFIPRLIRLPATLSPGEYIVRVTIVDKLGEKVAERSTPIRVAARVAGS